MRTFLRGVSCALGALAASLVFGAGAAVANTRGEPCVTADGVDLNQRYGVAETIVTPFCNRLRVGEHWRTPAAWLMAPAFDAVPAGFVPAGATPLADFRAKLAGVRYVVDPGTRQERTYTFANSSRLWSGVIDGLAAVNTVTLGRLHPLSKGQHVIDRYWQFSAMHCDGLAANAEENCLPAGEFLYSRVTFEVLPASG
jgi:hypothetical protein